jgi:putative membrane protein
MRLILRIIVNMVAVGLAAWLLPDSIFNISGGIWALFVFSLVIGIVNAFIGPIIRILSLPVTCITLGLFTFIINAILLLISGWLVNLLIPGSVDFGGANWLQTLLWAAVIAVVISIISGVLSWFLPDDDRK